VLAEKVGHAVIWGQSNNPTAYWGEDHRARIGWAPQDNAESWRAELEAITSDPVSERYQGGAYTAIEYSRDAPAPRDTFALE
jgi:uronate dehydrogenase